jgi:type VI secretion system protein ImpF
MAIVVERRAHLQRITPSILDRLIAQEIGVIGSVRADTIAGLRESVIRNLTDLLNTRTAEEPVPPEFEQASASMLAFGIPDFTQYNLRMAADQNRLRRSMEAAIRLFEPRLAGVTVAAAPRSETEATLRFLIEGWLRVESDNEPVTFDSVLRVDTGRFSVQERRR